MPARDVVAGMVGALLAPADSLDFAYTHMTSGVAVPSTAKTETTRGVFSSRKIREKVDVAHFDFIW